MKHPGALSLLTLLTLRGLVLFVDTETFEIVPGLLAPPLVIGSFCTKHDEPWLLEPDRAATAIEYTLEAEKVIVGHNIAYDLAVFVAHRPHLLGPVFEHYRKGLVRDTKIRQQLLDIASGDLKFHENEEGVTIKTRYGLADLSKRLLNIEVAKGEDTWRLRYRLLHNVPLTEWPEEAKQYALNDSKITREVYFSQETTAGGDITNEIEQTQAAWALHLMSVWGMRTDGAAVAALKDQLMEERQKARAVLVKVGFYKGVPFTTKDREEGRTPDYFGAYKAKNKKDVPRPMKYGKDMAAIKARVVRQFERKGQRVPTTESGEVSTERDVLDRSGSRLLKVLAESGAFDKILDTYIPALEQGAEVPLNPGFNVLVATGRTSSFKPNIQNIPSGNKRVRGVRETFVPREGFVFSSVDYDTLELRALAQVCLLKFGESKMAEALRAGKDLHLEVAAQILNVPYEDAYKRYKTGDKEVKRARDLAKVANFGFPGGMGPDSLCEFSRKSYGIPMEVDQARRLKHKFLSTWTEMGRYFEQHAQTPGLSEGRAKVTQLVSNRVRGGLSFCDLNNSLFQGFAADGAKAAMFKASYECYVDANSPLYGSRLVAFIHDELIAEHPEDIAHEAAHRLRDVMVEEMSGKYIKDIPVTASPVLMRRWSKEAKEVFKEGRLVPYEDAMKLAA